MHSEILIGYLLLLVHLTSDRCSLLIDWEIILYHVFEHLSHLITRFPNALDESADRFRRIGRLFG